MAKRLKQGVTLAMVVQDEADMLRFTLPPMRYAFDDFVAVDGGSTDDTVRILNDNNCRVFHRKWTNHHSNAQNFLLPKIDTQWAFFLDADEAVFGWDVGSLMNKLRVGHVFAQMPRVNFAGDFFHYESARWPDIQVRMVRMGRGFQYRGRIHKVLYGKGDRHPVAAMKYPSIQDDGCVIYHYGGCKPVDVQWLKLKNYDRISKGLPPLKEIPKGETPRIEWSDRRPYPMSHPLRTLSSFVPQH